MTAREVTTFSVEEHEAVAVVRARGELDSASQASFRDALERAAASGRPLVVVDLQDVSFLDSAGLAVVFGVQRQLDVGRRMALGNIPARMQRTLRLAAVGSVVDCWPEGGEQPWLPDGAPPAG